MKKYIVPLLLLAACKNQPATTMTPPADSIILQLIRSAYTAQNNQDGAEFATVDTLYILQKNMNITDSSCTVTYHINCSYQPAVMPPDYAKTRPAIDADTSINLAFTNHVWRKKE